MKRIFLGILFLMLCFCFLKAQQEDDADAAIENVYEYLMEDEEKSIDYEELYADLIAKFNHPINLNQATKDELESLHFLSDMQIENLLYYLYKVGKIQTTYELQLVEGFDNFTIKMLLPFVYVGTNRIEKISFKDMMKYGRNEFILRFDGTIQQREGSQPISQELYDEKPNSRYLGNPYYHSVKYRFSSQDIVQLGLSAEKDAGEPILSDYNKSLYSSYHAYIQLNNIKNFTTLVAGDYRASFGQGLLFSQAFSMGKSSLPLAVNVRASGLRRLSSTDEFNYLRGFGIAYRFDKWHFIGFYSFRKMDGAVQDSSFTSFKTDGLFQTPSDWEKRKTIAMQVAGVHADFTANWVKVGATIYGCRMDVPMVLNLRPYNYFYFKGKLQSGVSVDYQARWRNFNFYGETAMSDRNALATLNAVSFSPVSTLSLVLLQRYYSPKYDLFFANGFGENSKTNNESGLYLGAEIYPRRQWKISFFADVFKFPWLRYGVDEPSSGYELMTQLDYSFSRRVSMYARLRYKQKPTSKDFGDVMSQFVDFGKGSARFNMNYSVSNFNFKSAIQANFLQTRDSATTYGWLLLQDVAYNAQNGNWAVHMRYEIFDAVDYDNRLYYYENDVPYASYIPALYGQGLRYYALVKYKFSRMFSIYFRIAKTVYTDDREIIGSGLERIYDNHKTDFRVHLQWKF